MNDFIESLPDIQFQKLSKFFETSPAASIALNILGPVLVVSITIIFYLCCCLAFSFSSATYLISKLM